MIILFFSINQMEAKYMDLSILHKELYVQAFDYYILNFAYKPM